MELIQSLTYDAAPSITRLFKFGLISSLELIKKAVLTFPVNISIFVIIVFIIFYKISKMLLPKPKFNKVYTPLKHNDNSVEEMRVLKK